MAGALSIPIGQTFLKDTTQAAPIEPIAARAPARGSVYRLRYRLEDQAAGSAAYERERGARQLAFAADPAGEAVVLSEFSGDDGRPAYRLLFRSSPSAGQSEKPTVAVPLPSTGPVWIVWAPGRDSDLEGMLASASKDGLIADDDRRPLRHYLERNRGLRITEDRDPSTGQTVLTGSGERIVYRIEPEEEGPPRNP
jgi:hypothetical protein